MLRHCEDMAALLVLIVLIVLVALCALAAVAGVDSRPVEPRRHRPNWS
jgi:hypothetical protein